MKYLSIKDKRNRLFVKKLEQTKNILNSIISNKNLPLSVRWNAFLKLSKLPVKSSKIRLVNRCIITSRKNSINHFGISRIMFKNLAQKGSLPGFIKFNW